MSTTAISRFPQKNTLLLRLFCGFGVLILAAIAIPDLHRSKMVPSSIPLPEKPQGTLVSKAEVPVHFSSGRMAFAAGVIAPNSASASFDRKIVRTGSLQAIVKSPIEAAEKVRIMAEGLGGYVESLQINADQGAPTANMTIRVPAARLEDAKAEFRKLALRIEVEQSNASDVTTHYVDLDARIRNLRAQEAQYLAIMKSAVKVKDMLEVSEKLSEVRGDIEQQQAEFATLSKQVETVALTIALHAEPIAPAVAHWRPLYEMQLAARDALDGLTSYATTMMGVILEIPIVLLWLATIVLGAAGSWKVLRWVARVFFAYPKQQTV
jgi:Domain of unknown function (DUF4349)